MLNMDSFLGLMTNAGQMLVLCIVYDTFNIYRISNRYLRDWITGVLVGFISIFVMLTPWSIQPGVFFDTRWVLLSLCGLFFGVTPTAIAVVIAGAFRLSQGGQGGIVGTVVIVATAITGLCWGEWEKRRGKRLGWWQLYVFGVVVELVFLSCMFLMPLQMRHSIFKTIGPPVLIIYPVLTVIIGLILLKQEQRRKVEDDLTHANEVLELETERRRILFDQSPDGIAILDPQTAGFKEFNTAAHAQLGYSREEFARLTIPDIEVLESPEEIKTHIREVIDSGKADFETLQRTKQGEVRNIHVTAQVINVNGNQVYHCVWRDITDRKRAENEIRVFMESVETSSDAVGMATPDGRHYYQNKTFTELFGTIGEHPPETLFVDPGVGQAVFTIIMSGGQWAGEVKMYAKDGSIRDILLRAYASKDLSGRITALVGVHTDITEQKRHVEEKLLLEKQLLHAQKLESLGVLAGGIAHDFNNILMAILGNADLALMRINRESPVADNLHEIEKAAAKAADLAKQMLAYSGKGRFLVEPINLNHLIKDMLHMLEVSISKKAVIRLNLHEDLPGIEADATQMRQIIMNLVINASEAIGDKSGFIAITTGCMDCDQNYLKDVWLDANIREGLYVYLEIADTGCGMSNETMAKIFDPFFTTKFTGRGLGMAAVLGIVRGHKGAIRVYSELNKGTTFKILFPASDRPPAIFNSGHTHEDWCCDGTVLLVDDEETVRGIGKEMLKELGFKVITAYDGREAVEVFRANQDISFVILDLTMPHMDGEQCFRELRQIKPDIKVIMSSGFNEQEVTQKFAGKGLAGFIQKPYKLSTLQATVKKVLANS